MPLPREQHPLDIKGILQGRDGLKHKCQTIGFCRIDQLINLPHIGRAHPAAIIFSAGILHACLAESRLKGDFADRDDGRAAGP